MVGGLTRRARPAHTRACDSHLAPDCHGHTHTSTALFPFAQANTYRERLSIKGLWGERKGGVGSVQGKVSASKGVGQRPRHLQLLQACPGLLGVGRGSWGVEDSRRAGRHKRHVLGDSKPVTVAAATMSCVYCVDIWQREGPLPHTWGLGAWVWPALARGEACSEPTSCGAGWGWGWRDVRLAVRQIGSAVLSCPSGLPQA